METNPYSLDSILSEFKLLRSNQLKDLIRYEEDTNKQLKDYELKLAQHQTSNEIVSDLKNFVRTVCNIEPYQISDYELESFVFETYHDYSSEMRLLERVKPEVEDYRVKYKNLKNLNSKIELINVEKLRIEKEINTINGEANKVNFLRFVRHAYYDLVQQGKFSDDVEIQEIKEEIYIPTSINCLPNRRCLASRTITEKEENTELYEIIKYHLNRFLSTDRNSISKNTYKTIGYKIFKLSK